MQLRPALLQQLPTLTRVTGLLVRLCPRSITNIERQLKVSKPPQKVLGFQVSILVQAMSTRDSILNILGRASLESIYRQIDSGIRRSRQPPSRRSNHNPPPMSLLNLPNEILLLIAKHISPSVRDLNFFCQTNRHLNILLAPLIFEYILQNVDPLLLWASQKGGLALARVALEHGADISRSDKYGWSLLHIAAANGHDPIVRLLLEKGINIDVVSPNGKTALERAAHFGHTGVVKILIERGLNINTMDSDGQTALHSAAANGRDSVIQVLLENGADINLQGSVQGNTPLHWAAMRGHNATVLMFLDKGANITIRDLGGRTILHYAVRSGNEEVVRSVLDRGADVDINVCNNNGETAFHTAMFEMSYTWDEKWKGVLRLLVERGINPKAMDNSGSTGLDIALDGGCPWSPEIALYSQIDAPDV